MTLVITDTFALHNNMDAHGSCNGYCHDLTVQFCSASGDPGKDYNVYEHNFITLLQPLSRH